jgi:hypothetical protein
MEIAAESGLGTTLLGNLMVANRPVDGEFAIVLQPRLLEPAFLRFDPNPNLRTAARRH